MALLAAKSVSLIASLVVAALGVYLMGLFTITWAAGFQVTPTDNSCFALPAINARFSLGVDAISLFLVALTILLMPLSIAASFASNQDRLSNITPGMLAMDDGHARRLCRARSGCSSTSFFELTLIRCSSSSDVGRPRTSLCGGKFFLFTFAGSVFHVWRRLVYLGLKAGTFDIDAVTRFARCT